MSQPLKTFLKYVRGGETEKMYFLHHRRTMTVLDDLGIEKEQVLENRTPPNRHKKNNKNK